VRKRRVRGEACANARPGVRAAGRLRSRPQLRCQAASPPRPAASAAQAGRARRRAGEVDADAAVVPADALSRQALEAQAGDLAIEDALYAVEKALQAGAITPDVYIKQARPVAGSG
jgi:ESCRT-I complex subunit TSG101